MIVYHVTSYAKLTEYIETGFIVAPVRAWETANDAERFSLSTGRRVILRLNFPDTAEKLDGHFGRARVLRQHFKINETF